MSRPSPFEFLAGDGAAAGFNAEVFAERLRMLRARARLTQEEVARYVGVSRGTVSAWENAKPAKFSANPCHLHVLRALRV